MRGHAAGWLAIFVLWASARPALASELSAELQVFRGEGAQDCPDLAALTRRVLELGNASRTTEPLQVEVRFEHEHAEYQATIVSQGRKSGVRTLSTASSDCSALASAVTVALAVLLDVNPPDESPTSAPVVEAPNPAGNSFAVPSPSGPPHAVAVGPSAPRLRALPWVWSVPLLWGAGYGLLGPNASGQLTTGVELERRSLRVGLEAFTTLPRTDAFEVGFVSVWLTGARIESCIFSTPERRARLGVCPGLGVGALRGQGRRFDVERTSWQPWVAAFLALTTSVPVSARWSFRARASAVLPLAQNRFRIDGLGVGYSASPAALLVDLGPELRFW